MADQGGKVFNRDVRIAGGGSLYVGEVKVVDSFGNVLANITDTLPSGKIYVGNSSNVAAEVTMSGDGSLSNTGVLTVTKLAGAPKRVQATPTAKTVSATLTAAEILVGIVTVNQAGGATSAQQLPTVADLEAALTGEANDDAFDFHVINTSTVDAEDASITTNTGWTLVGSMDIHAYSAAGSLNSSAHFRARKTGSGAWTLYRLA